jgi:uncharacterized membrane protein
MPPKPRKPPEPPAPRWHLSAFGLLLGGLFFAASLTPSLMPRPPLWQGVLGGVALALGYGVARGLTWLWHFLELPGGRAAMPLGLRVATAAAGAAAALAALWAATGWQNGIRARAGLPPLDTIHPWQVGALALAVFAVLLAAGIAFRLVLGLVARQFDRVMPRRISAFLGFAVSLWLFWALIDGVLVRRVMAGLDASFAAADALTPPDTDAPADPGKTGSPASLVRWDELGRWGRVFVASAPTPAEISAFTGRPAREPVRVFVGRLAADTPEARADLALRELIRQGGFERRILIVAVPVGTGWMDPGAADTLEFMQDGDVATVTVQYSYLTSVLSLLVDYRAGVDQAKALFDRVYAHWSALPEDARPKLYVHGLSQAALNTQSAVPFFNLLADPIDGALWVGSPFLSEVWATVRDRRDPASPSWQPRFGNGSLVRVMNQNGAQAADPAPWGPMRLMFLSYPSDAIVAFSWADLWREPVWMREPPPPDVSPALRWFPVVTGLQLAIDMAVSLQVPRFGHFYVAPDYLRAWAELTDPPGWSEARAAALTEVFARRPPPF